MSGGGASSCGATSPVTFTQLHGSFTATTPGGRFFPGGFDAPTRRGFAFPISTASSLQTLHTLRLEDAGTALPDGGSRAFFEPLPVRGNVPNGDLVAASYDEQSNVLTGVFLATNPLHYEVATLTVSNTEARFTTLTQADSPDANGFTITRLDGTSASMGAQLGNDVRALTVSGSQATWGPPVAAQVFSELSAYDRVHDRMLSIGKFTFVPPMSVTWTSDVLERAPTAPSWSPVSMSGMGLTPVVPSMAPYAFLAYDAADDRLLVAGTRPMMIGGTTVQVTTAIEASLRTHQWRDLDTISSVVERAPFFYDRAGRQVFTSQLTAYSLAPGRELKQQQMPLTGRLPPQAFSLFSNAARLGDGRALVVADQLLTFTPATMAWDEVPVTLPPQHARNASVAWDPVGQRALVLFGERSGGGSPSNQVSALSADGRTLTPVVTTGTPPPARVSAATVVIGTSLVVVGGSSGATMLGDVFVLDLTTLAWRSLGTVTPRANAGLVARGGGVVVAGGRTSTSAFVPVVEQVELTSGAVQVVAVSGTPPEGVYSFAPFGSGLAGFDVGSTLDLAPNALVELRLGTGQASWERTPTAMKDAAVYPTVGLAGASCNEALFVGPSTIRVTR